MAITLNSDVHSIKQVGPAAIGVAFQSTPILAIPGLTVDVSKRIEDAGGETISFPYWNTDMTNMTQDAVRNSRTGVAANKISLASYDETASAKTVSIDGDEYAFRDGSENHLDHIAMVVGREFAKVVQAELITKAVAGTDLTLNITAETVKTLNVDAILEARLKWGDHAGELSPYLFVRTKQFSDLAKSSDYKTQAAGTNGLVNANEDWSKFVVGTVHGIPVVLCDACPTDTVPVTDTHTALLVGPEAFGVYIADEPISRTVPHAGSTVVTLDSHFRYATTLFRHAPKRVVKIVTE